MQNPWFKKSRFRGGKGKRGSGGVRERPGLGASEIVSTHFSILLSIAQYFTKE